ncbi:MAG: protein kinase [Peptococcaceae bacterium]|nr:protein kinase [Peptococcaceae bacterium]
MDGIKKFEPLWGVWYVESFIGEGSFGKVYKVRRQEYGKTFIAAVKIISIPQDKSEIQQLEIQGLDEASIRNFYQALIRDITNEIDLISTFKGNSNIVSFEDYQIVENPDFFLSLESRTTNQESSLWDILIRMELLESLASIAKKNPLPTAEVLRLGIHICRALELCAQKNIVHRDIKSDNIFISELNEYKLGDFGIARQIERSMSGLSKKGTNSTMAPEVFRGERYGADVDTYALGIVMYSLLNGNRLPFLPDYPQPIMPNEWEGALQRRMSGEPLPVLKQIGPELNALVRKAAAYNRQERFGSPGEMRCALEALMINENQLSASGTWQLLSSVSTDAGVPLQEETLENPITEAENSRASIRTESCLQQSDRGSIPADGAVADQTQKERRRKGPLVIGVSLGAVLVLLAVGLAVFLINNPKGYGISINDQVNIVVSSQREAQEVLDELAEHYLNLAEVNSVSSFLVTYEEEVEIVPVKKPSEKIQKQEALQALINEKPLNVIIKGECELIEDIEFETETIKDANLDLNTTEIEQEGRKGSKRVSYAFVLKNGDFINKDMCGEVLLIEPVKEIILEGSRIVNLSDAIAALPNDEAERIIWQSIQGYWLKESDFAGFIYGDARQREFLPGTLGLEYDYGSGELKSIKANGAYNVTLTFYFPVFRSMGYSNPEFTYIMNIDLSDREQKGIIRIKGSGGLIGVSRNGEYRYGGSTIEEMYNE